MTLTCVNCNRQYNDHRVILAKSPLMGLSTGRCQKCRAVKGTANGNSIQKRLNRAWQK